MQVGGCRTWFTYQSMLPFAKSAPTARLELPAIAIIVILTRVIDTGNHVVLALAAEQKLRLGAENCISSPDAIHTSWEKWLLLLIDTWWNAAAYNYDNFYLLNAGVGCSTGPQFQQLHSLAILVIERVGLAKKGWGLMNLIYCFVRRMFCSTAYAGCDFFTALSMIEAEHCLN
jgi:hypothetical protein